MTSCLQGRRSNHLSYDPVSWLDTGRNRTDVFPVASRALYQLSYRPMFDGYWSGLNRHLSPCQSDALPIKLQTHTIAIAKRCCDSEALATLGASAQIANPKNSVQVFRAICVLSVTRGTPPMSYYTLFKGWLPLSPPIGFFALPVRHAHCI